MSREFSHISKICQFIIHIVLYLYSYRCCNINNAVKFSA